MEHWHLPKYLLQDNIFYIYNTFGKFNVPVIMQFIQILL